MSIEKEKALDGKSLNSILNRLQQLEDMKSDIAQETIRQIEIMVSAYKRLIDYIDITKIGEDKILACKHMLKSTTSFSPSIYIYKALVLNSSNNLQMWSLEYTHKGEYSAPPTLTKDMIDLANKDNKITKQEWDTVVSLPSELPPEEVLDLLATHLKNAEKKIIEEEKKLRATKTRLDQHAAFIQNTEIEIQDLYVGKPQSATIRSETNVAF